MFALTNWSISSALTSVIPLNNSITLRTNPMLDNLSKVTVLFQRTAVRVEMDGKYKNVL